MFVLKRRELRTVRPSANVVPPAPTSWRVAGRGGSDTDETMPGDSENHIAVQPAKSGYSAPMLSRLQRDRTAGAADLATCASSTSFNYDGATKAGVLRAGTTGARGNFNSTAVPGVCIVNTVIPASASYNHK